MGLTEAVGVGRLAGLCALRDVLAAEIEVGPREWSGKGPVPVSQTASLAARLIEVLKQIEVIESAQPKGSVVDELEGKRASRRSTATSGGATGRGGHKRRTRGA
jgi:hypothetical protein